MAGKSIAVLDIRSSEVAVFVGERGVNRTFVFKASKTESYGGYQDGEFYDVSDLSAAVLRALDAVQQVCGEKIRSLYVGVPGEFTKVEPREQDLGFPKKLKISNKELDQLFSMGKKQLDGWLSRRVTRWLLVAELNRRFSDPVGIYSTGLAGVLSYFYVSEYFASPLDHIFSRRRIELHFLPTQFAMAAYLIPPETRDEYALFLDIGHLSSSFLVLLGNGVLAQRTFWAGEGQIAVRLMKRFSLPYEVATALLAKANLYLKRDAKNREVVYGGRSYEIPTKEFIEEVKAGLDDLCELVGRFLEECSGKELDSKPIYVSGEGFAGIRGALEHMSKRLSCVCEQVAPDLPYYNKPSMSSRIALIDMASEDSRASGSLKRFLNIFGG